MCASATSVERRYASRARVYERRTHTYTHTHTQIFFSFVRVCVCVCARVRARAHAKRGEAEERDEKVEHVHARRCVRNIHTERRAARTRGNVGWLVRLSREFALRELSVGTVTFATRPFRSLLACPTLLVLPLSLYRFRFVFFQVADRYHEPKGIRDRKEDERT